MPLVKKDRAIFSQRLSNGEPVKVKGQTIQQGDKESYEPRCRVCICTTSRMKHLTSKIGFLKPIFYLKMVKLLEQYRFLDMPMFFCKASVSIMAPIWLMTAPTIT